MSTPREVCDKLHQCFGEAMFDEYGLRKCLAFLTHTSGMQQLFAAKICSILFSTGDIGVIAAVFNDGRLNINNANEHNMRILRESAVNNRVVDEETIAMMGF